MNKLLILAQYTGRSYKDKRPQHLLWSDRILRCDEIFHINGKHVYTKIHYDMLGEHRVIAVMQTSKDIEEMIKDTNKSKIDIIEVVKG